MLTRGDIVTGHELLIIYILLIAAFISLLIFLLIPPFGFALEQLIHYPPLIATLPRENLGLFSMTQPPPKEHVIQLNQLLGQTSLLSSCRSRKLKSVGTEVEACPYLQILSLQSSRGEALLEIFDRS